MSTPPSRPSLLRLQGVSRVFDQGAVVALRDVSLQIATDECIALVGVSGSGKSSLISIMTGIAPPTAGEVFWNGQAIESRKQWAALRGSEIGIVFQEFHLIPTLTALENVELAMFGHSLTAVERRRKASAALDRVGLGARLGHLPQALSGGERQRVAIARSIINRPKLLLADEPTGNLDSTNMALIADLLLDLQRAGTALVLATHNETLALRCRRQIRLRDGQIVDDWINVAAELVQAERAPV
jgi:predicted ABC-type transport system involved in lysophospholipase L1 biosynthesis ATPase subunit